MKKLKTIFILFPLLFAFLSASAQGTETFITNIFTGAMVYKSAFADFAQKAWFYTDQHIEKSRVTAVNTKTNSVETTLVFDKPIGDVVFNPYRNEFIVIENKNSSTAFQTYNAISNTFKQAFQTNNANCQKMFIDPNNHLYITTNMIPNNGSVKIIIYDATSYDTIKTLSFQVPVNGSSTDGYLKAKFDFNYHNNAVYAVFHRENPGIVPSSSPSSYPEGAFIKIADDLTLTTISTNNMYNPEDIYCDNNSWILTGDYSQEAANDDGTCFIKMLDTDHPTLYNCHSGTFTTIQIISLKGITYNPRTDLFYGVNNGTYGKVYSIDKNGNHTQIISSQDLGGCQNIRFNHFNGRLYMYSINFIYGTDHNIYLYSLNPENSAAGLTQTYLHNKSLRITGENEMFYKNRLLFDPYSNHILIPNGTHGNISVVAFDALEELILKPSYKGESNTWLSFPRTRNDNGDPSLDEVLIHYQNEGDNVEPANYKELSKIISIPLSANNEASSTFDANNWPSDDISSVDHTFGYDLTLKYLSQASFDVKLLIKGNNPDPSTTLTLYNNDRENWVGYWLYYKQDIFDALGTTADQIDMIKHQDWTCIKTIAPWMDPEDPGQNEVHWYCDHKITNIQYGDMVKLSGNSSNIGFQWKLQGNSSGIGVDYSPQHYTYEEQNDYKPLTIELDSADSPQEIGAFVNDSCIGATALAPDDSMVVIRAYVDNSSNDTITFQKYYGTKSTGKHKVNNYYVYNRYSKTWKKGYAVNHTGIDRFFVSFKTKKIIKPAAENKADDFAMRIYPNPAKKLITIEYRINKYENLTLTIFDTQGRIIYQTGLNNNGAGQYNTVWNLKTENGYRVNPGIYLLKLSSSKQNEVKRVIVE